MKLLFLLLLIITCFNQIFGKQFTKDYVKRINHVLVDLNITYDDIIVKTGGKLQFETENLLFIGFDHFGREQYLEPKAAKALNKMIAAAAKDGINLYIISAFRSVEYQATIIKRKLSKDMTMKEILHINAIPGFSEHHTGKAVDLHTDNVGILKTSFARTRAYKWLKKHAFSFGFRETYTKDNKLNIMFEPWHWYYFK